jgi:hypothetical protein
MEVKPEASTASIAPKQEVQTPQAPKGKNFNQNQNQQQQQQGGSNGGPNGPNMRGKKNFPNRGGKMGNNPQGNNNRGPMKNEVSVENEISL